MKIKLDKVAANQLAVVATQAVYAAIKDNKMSIDFETAGIKGEVFVRKLENWNYPTANQVYGFTVKLFDRITVTDNGIAMIGYHGDAISITQDGIRSQLQVMIDSNTHINAMSDDLIKKVHEAIAKPGTVTVHNPVPGVELEFGYTQVTRETGKLGDNVIFETIFKIDDELQAHFKQFGNCSMSVNPLHTGVLSMLLSQLQQLIMLRKENCFYITEETTWNPQYQMPMLQNPMGYGQPNPMYNSMQPGMNGYQQY